MSARRDEAAIEAAERRQREAADPVASVWVAANAGAGTTRVLVDRVARLLLAGARPHSVLCLTFTRAAAAEMLRRLGIDGKALLVDVKPEDKLALSVRNIEGIRLLPSNRISARDVMNTRRVVLTRAALEKLQEALG